MADTSEEKSPTWSQQSVATTVGMDSSLISQPFTIVGASSAPTCSNLVGGVEVETLVGQNLSPWKGNDHVYDLEARISNGNMVSSSSKFAWLRYTALNVYRRLFSLVFLGNLATFIYVLSTDQKLLTVVNAAVANLLALGLARQPLVVNALFVTFGSIPRSAPFFLRKLCAKIYCYGGVHSGCGVASLVWYVGFIGLLTRQYTLQGNNITVTVTPAIMILSYVILCLLLLIIIAAYPTIRARLHDYFELTHRFCGWTVIILFWPLLILFSVNAATASGQSLGQFLVRFPTFWMVIVCTMAILHPWLLLRRVKVKAEVISTHAIRLHFDHRTINFSQGLSVSKHPLKDWHSFATFPDMPSVERTNGTTKELPDFSCLVSKAGDWTSHTIANPPTHLWKRGIPIYGFGYVMKVFNRIVLVTTGSGIGPCLSFLGDPGRPEMRVIWQTRTPLRTYGQPIMDLVTLLDPDPYIIDTSLGGKRVDMFPLVVKLFRQFEAEAVCIISNPVMTRKLVFDCEASGIPAFGPIFDS